MEGKQYAFYASSAAPLRAAREATIFDPFARPSHAVSLVTILAISIVIIATADI